jgi:hypothetical protein
LERTAKDEKRNGKNEKRKAQREEQWVMKFLTPCNDENRRRGTKQQQIAPLRRSARSAQPAPQAAEERSLRVGMRHAGARAKACVNPVAVYGGDVPQA